MPRRTFTDRFRRVSTPDVFRRSSKVDPSSLQPLAEAAQRPLPARSKSVPDTLISRSSVTTLLSLPTEIYSQILAYGDFKDVSAFGLVCRATHYLVSEGDIIRHWINEHVDTHRLFLHTPPSPPTFAYILQQQRRFLAVTNTADVLVDYIEHQILRYTLRRANINTDQYRQGLFGLVKIRLKDRMTPLLFTIQAYLELLAASHLSCPDDSGQLVREAEHTFFASLAPDHLLQTHKCFHFLTWLSNQILSRPSYAGTMERTMRGWLSDPLDVANFRLYLLFGNLAALRQLVQLPSYKHRRKAVEAWLRRMDPEQDVLWKENWARAGSVGNGCAPGREEGARGLQLRLDAEQIWVRAAREALVEKGSIKAGEEKEIGTPWQTMVRMSISSQPCSRLTVVGLPLRYCRVRRASHAAFLGDISLAVGR